MENYSLRDLSVYPCERKEIRDFIEEHHYSKNINGCKSSFHFCLKDNKDNIVGALFYGHLSTTAWKKFSENEKSVIELRRLVLIDECPKNSESYFIGKTIRSIKNNKEIDLIVSYADPYHKHYGAVYQASNWIYIGKTSKDCLFLDKETGKTYHSRALRTKYKGEYKPFVKILRQKREDGILSEIEVPGKYTYIYPMNKKTRKKWNLKSLEYPKPDRG